MTGQNDKPLLSTRKIIVQVVGWLLGLGLLGWVIYGAVNVEDKSGWESIKRADPMLVAALLGCTIVSTICNASTFWITIQPLRNVRWLDMQYLNVVANMLNYAPVRLGALLRVLYHLRVDRLNVLQVGAWFSMIAYVLFLGVGAAVLATLIRAQVDWIWLALVLVQMAIGGVAARFVAGLPLIARYARGVDQLFVNRKGLWSAIALRVIDLGAYAGRMGAAVAILGLSMPASNVVVLAMVALAASLVPVGKVGVREFAVAKTATLLSMHQQDVKGTWEQLALIESAGEAIFFIPLGAVLLFWFRRKMSSPTRIDAPADPPIV